MNKTAILFTANDKHVAQGALMLASLRSPDLGNYAGDIFVLSTELGSEAKKFLERNNIGYFVDELAFASEWSEKQGIKASLYNNYLKQFRRKAGLIAGLRAIAKAALSVAGVARNGEKKQSPQAVFSAWRNKRMSKLILLSFLRANMNKYDRIIVCDNDLFFQKDVSCIFNQIQENRIYYWQEENPIAPGCPLWVKNQAYYRKTGVALQESLSFLDCHEINIGLIGGTPESIFWLFDGVKQKMLLPEHKSLILNHNWHDQDFSRLLRFETPERFVLFAENTVVHLCNGGNKLIEEIRPMSFCQKTDGQVPAAVHFAGGAWEAYPSVRDVFHVDHIEFFASSRSRP